MIKEIKYEGYTEVPSDYECPDGDLAMAQGVLPDEGTLQPILPATDLAILPAGYKIVFIHATSQMKHYIVHRPSTGAFYWMDKSIIDDAQSYPVTITTSDLHQISSFTSIDYNSINAVGNVLMVMDADGIHYFLWDGSLYKDLGNHIPELPISFGLNATIVRTEELDRDFSAADIRFIAEMRDGVLTEEHRKVVSEEILGSVNKFIQDKVVKEGKFIYPFLVRYAYRLYDQTLTMHSAPILMVCSSDAVPLVPITRYSYGGDGDLEHLNYIRYYVAAAVQTLVYKVDASGYGVLSDWKDIVSSVDIFVSAPLYNYDQNGLIERFIIKEYNGNNAWEIGYNPWCVSEYNGGNVFQKNDIIPWYTTLYDIPSGSVTVPRFSDTKIKNAILSAHDFYLISSIKIDDLSSSLTDVPIREGDLEALVAREAMTDDYDSHDTLVPAYSHVYNSRLNIANLSKTLFDGFAPSVLMPISNVSPANWKAWVFIRQDNKEIVVESPESALAAANIPYYLYYPNKNAYKMVLFNGGDYKQYDLEQHDFLNGAVFFNGWSESGTFTVVPHPTADKTIYLPNVMYTSEVNNPFEFPSSGINTVGIGEIHGIASAVRPLSEGQFGEYPLYAFTTEGVWALEFRSDGVFVARQPVTRDVVIKPGVSITSIDTAVLFATERGIMLLQGSNTKCISEELEAEHPFNLIEIKNGVAVYPGAAALTDIAQVNSDAITLPNIKEFVKDCRMLYDYKNQRIIVYTPSDRCVLVYNLKTGKWGMMAGTIVDGINSYPEALAMTQSGSGSNFVLTDFSDLDTSATMKGLLVTRPLKLDYPNDLKTIRNIIQRGKFIKGHVKQVLWGSRDLINWHLIGSSVDHYLHNITGTPYKYFRLGLPIDMVEGENLYGCTVEYELKETNRLR